MDEKKDQHDSQEVHEAKNCLPTSSTCKQLLSLSLSLILIMFALLRLGRAFGLFGNKTVDLTISDGNSSDTGKSYSDSVHSGRLLSPPPLGNREQCTVSKDKLEELTNRINDTLSSNDETSAETVSCSFNSTNPDNCAELIKLMQCGVKHLNEGFLGEVANEASSVQVTKWKNAYDELSEKFKRELDRLQKSLSQKYQRELDDLETQLQDLNRKSEDALRKVYEKISEIASGKIDEVILNYKSLDDGDKTKLTEIVRAVYNEYGRLDQLDNIVEFMRYLHFCDQLEVVYPVLIELLKANDQLYSLKTLDVIWAMEGPSCVSNGFFKSLKIQESKANLIATLASNIRNNNYQQYKKFDKNHGRILRDNIGELVRQAYANSLSNAETLINFIRDLYSISSSIVGLNSLFDQMQNNGHLDSYQFIMLVYRVKQLMEMPYYPTVEQQYKEMAENLKSKSPYSVMRLIWGGSKCTVINKHHNEYLYAAGLWYKTWDGFRAVFTWRPKDHPGEKEAYLDFEPFNTAKEFYIRSNYYDEYIISPNGTPYDSERRKIYTKSGKWRNSYWRIEPVENAQYFRIYNTYRNQYLYADEKHEHDAERRNVFTWSGGSMYGDRLEESKWKINC
jgi:hypothetical protein